MLTQLLALNTWLNSEQAPKTAQPPALYRHALGLRFQVRKFKRGTTRRKGRETGKLGKRRRRVKSTWASQQTGKPMFAWHRFIWLQYPQRSRSTAVSLIPRLVYVTGGSTTLVQWMRFQCVNATDKFQRRWKTLVFSVSFTLLEFVGLSKFKETNTLTMTEFKWTLVNCPNQHYPRNHKTPSRQFGKFWEFPFYPLKKRLGCQVLLQFILVKHRLLSDMTSQSGQKPFTINFIEDIWSICIFYSVQFTTLQLW